MARIVTRIGTRPEIIQMAPGVKALSRYGGDPTGDGTAGSRIAATVDRIVR